MPRCIASSIAQDKLDCMYKEVFFPEAGIDITGCTGQSCRDGCADRFALSYVLYRGRSFKYEYVFSIKQTSVQYLL